MFSSRLISRWLLLIVTLTILSPRFAWDVMAADAHHNPVFSVHEQHDHDADDPALDHADHHAGYGYLFTHLPAQISAFTLLFAVATGNDFEPAIALAHASRNPDRLERPPRLRSA